MKKKLLVSLLLTTALLGACQEKKDTKETVDSGKKISIGQVAADLKEQYGENPLEYAEESLAIERDQPIKLGIGFNPTDLGMKNYTEIVELYQDSDLTQSVGTHFNMDKETTFIEVLPPRSAVAPISQNKVDRSDHGYDGANNLLFQKESNKDWGTLEQLYMKIKVDLKTGEALAKPQVTPVQIKHEVSGNLRLKLAINDEGLPEFSWNELAGADYYYLVDVDYTSEKGITGLTNVREKITDGTHFAAEPSVAFTTFQVSELERQDKKNIEKYGEGTGAIPKETPYERQFAVVAVNTDGTSAMSNTLSLKELAKRIPYKEEVAKSSQEEGGTIAVEMGMLPSYRWVTMSDGSLVQKLINYDISKAKPETELWASYEKDDLSDLEAHEVELITVPYTVEGTPFAGKAKVENYYIDTWKGDLEKIKERQDKLRNKAGSPQVEITAEEQEEPKEPIETVVSNSQEETKESNESTEESTTSSSKRRRRKTTTTSETKESQSQSSETVESMEDSTVESTEESKRKKESKESETISEVTDKITGNNALSNYLAINMLAGNTEIDILEFPEGLIQDKLFDAWMEAIYQNPLILGVEGAQITNFGATLNVTYNIEEAEMKTKQEELRKEVKKVVAEIIKKDMSDLEKEYAINNYLIEIAEYDDAALENAEKNDFVNVDAEFNDSFTPYGVLINKVGVCASYAGAFKLLADEAGLEAIVVTGYLEGDLPHAWNKVKIDGEWYILDSTNNDNEFLKNALLNIPSNASSKVLVEDDRYVLDTHIEDYQASDEDKDSEYYHVTDQFYDEDKIVSELVAALKKEGQTSLRTNYNLTDERFSTIGSKVVEEMKDDDLQGFYWMGVIHLISSK